MISNLFKKSNYLKVDPNKPTDKAINRAGKILNASGIIIYPTDTLYGFGVKIDNHDAIRKLYKIKGREKSKPFSIMVNSVSQAEQIVGTFSPEDTEIFKKLLPGKITLLVKARKKITIPGFEKLEKIGFRIPQSKICERLVEIADGPISTSSVNFASSENLADSREIRHLFGKEVDLIIDGGPVHSLKGSSVIDLTTFPPRLLREGEVLLEEIEKKLGIKLISDIKRKFIITFVCSGNICRSPMAEGILKKQLDGTNYQSMVEINSAGTLNLPPTVAALEAVKVADGKDVDLTRHLSRPVDRRILDRANIIFCMADNHFDYLNQNYPEFKDKIFLLKTFATKKEILEVSIPDPIGMSEKVFQKVYHEIEKQLFRIMPILLKQISAYLDT
ncbi:MAG: threonylcarbamoyl-AMP synthase [Calditrichales bacterium]|nr:MAG: threonylcarbamoyl-AMP synthase [Calditrichales bacterium]